MLPFEDLQGYDYSKHNEQECASRKGSGFNATRETFIKLTQHRIFTPTIRNHTSHRASREFAGEEYCQDLASCMDYGIQTMQQLHDKTNIDAPIRPIPSRHLSIFTSTLLSRIF